MPGGVCAVLDYETDMMSEYVADMATRIVIPRSTVTPAFRKFVNQILTSTRLPSTTILLGMNYLAKHMNRHMHTDTYKTVSEGELWKMVTVALLLGSKFLDDNTFQNRSWSDVSGIDVAEINAMEGKWLRDMDWVLYVNLDRSHDYDAWLKSWNQYQDSKRQVIQQHQSHATLRERLAPIVTSVHNEATRQPHHPLSYEGWTHEEIADQERLTMNTRLGRPGKMAYRPREGSWPNRYQNPWVQAPLTPPDSGYGTPEYLNSAASVNSRYNEWFSQAVANQNYGRYSHAPTGHHNYSSSRSGSHFHQYFNHFGHTAWDAGVAECNCASCLGAVHAKAGSYFHPQPYGQPVMG
ncbi:putative cyclin-like protein [Rosellinia necatrix]|uniref:Putative cyclin-like protein n=1 Tax=Rosellinia necatrix TaxID=77044 RepID=A0A1S7UHY3_ROSNE|nr:putative cyclin-like protein [Rosellinia necatrix]